MSTQYKYSLPSTELGLEHLQVTTGKRVVPYSRGVVGKTAASLHGPSSLLMRKFNKVGIREVLPIISLVSLRRRARLPR